MSKFTTLSRAREYLMVTDQSEDALLDRLITSCSGLMETYMNRKLNVATYTDKFDGRGNNFHVFKNYPVLSVESLGISNSLLNTGYNFNEDQIVLDGGVFPRGMINCSVTYTAGYAKIPDDIEQACLEFVSFKYKQRSHIDLASKALAGETTAFITSDIPSFIKVVLNNYKKVF